MPSITGVGSFKWTGDYLTISNDYPLVWVMAKCTSCGHEWKWEATKNKVSSAVISVKTHRTDGMFEWLEAQVVLSCPNCLGDARFKVGLHKNGCVTITNVDGFFDAMWWIDPMER